MACGRSPRSKSKGTAAKRRWCRQGDQVAHEIENVSRVVDQANALGDIVDHSCSILWGKRMSAADADVTEPVLAKGRGNHSFNRRRLDQDVGFAVCRGAPCYRPDIHGCM